LEVIAVARDGRLSGYYVNINLPYKRRDDGYEAKDLFLDLWVWADGGFTILDEDEFVDARRDGLVTADEARFAYEALSNTVRMINFHRFPPKEVIEHVGRWLGCGTSAEPSSAPRGKR
jgi:predicted RNA-binding protein associated with RNAse of E/G family